MVRIRWFFLCLSFFLVSCFDSQQFDPIHYDHIIKTSLPEPPLWIYQTYVESKNHFYFVRSMRSEFHMPSLTYTLVRRDLHVFFEKESKYILKPILRYLTRDRYYKLVKEFSEFLSTQLMVSVRRSRSIYWEKVSFNKQSMSEIGYWYYVLLPVSKQSLRRYEHVFILKKIDFARNNQQKLFIDALEVCLDLVSTLRDNDAKKQRGLPDDYVFETHSD